MNGSAADIAVALRERQHFILTSHARPDGDAVGSSLALALALDALGKRVEVVLADPAPAPYRDFPAVDRIQITDHVETAADAVVLLECSDLERPGVAGLEKYFVINVDHHLGNGMYGAVNWFDETAAACGEQVANIIDALGVAWTPAIAQHLFLAIATDTGSFRYGPISTRTFEICRRIAALGIDIGRLSRQIFDNYSVGRVRITGAILNAMELHHDRKLAILAFDDALLQRCGASNDDTEGLVNLPLAAREVLAVALLKRQDATTFRVSLRSKGDVDVRALASECGGGGHRNAAGYTVVGEASEIRQRLVFALTRAIDASAPRA